MLTWLCAFASAADLLPNHLGNPNAVPIDAGRGQVEVGVATLLVLQNGVYANGVVGLTDRLALSGGAYASHGLAVCFAGCSDDHRVGGQVAARYLVVRSDAFSLAVWGSAARGTTNMDHPGIFVEGSLLHGGLALEGGGERVRFDASAPLLSYGLREIAVYGTSVDWLLRNGELGVSYAWADNVVRLGMVGIYAEEYGATPIPLPALSWRTHIARGRYRLPDEQPGGSGPVSFEVGVGPVVSFQVGVQF